MCVCVYALNMIKYKNQFQFDDKPGAQTIGPQSQKRNLPAQRLTSNHTLRVVIVAHHEAVHHSVGANRNALGNHHLSLGDLLVAKNDWQKQKLPKNGGL